MIVKIKNQLQKDFILLALIQISSILVAIGIAAIGPACTPELEEISAPLGPEASVDAVALAFMEALSGNSVLASEPGAMVYYENNLRVDIGSVNITSSTKRELIRKEENTDMTRLVIKHTHIAYNHGDDPKVTITDDVVDISKDYVTKSIKQSHQQYQEKILTARGKVNSLSDQLHNTYHNLRSRSYKLTPPSSITQTPNCRELPGCQLDATEVSYDVVIWQEEKELERYSVKQVFSPQIPYLMTGADRLPVVNECIRYLTELEDRSYYVSECFALKDFQN